MVSFHDLVDVGLTENEAKSYLALLERGSCTASLVAKRSGVNRSVCYSVLDDLIRKGMASYAVRNNVRYFTPAPPERLATWISEKENRARALAIDLAKLGAPIVDERAEIFKGLEGLRTAIDHFLNLEEDWHVIGWTGALHAVSPTTFNAYERRRVKAGITRYAVSTRANKPVLSKLPLTKARYLAKEYLSPSSIAISGDMVVVFMPWRKEPLAFLFESREAAQSHRKYFDLLWKIAKP